MNFSKKVFTINNFCATLIVQEGEYPEILKIIRLISWGGGIPRFVFHTKGSSRLRAGKRYEDYDLRKTNDGP